LRGGIGWHFDASGLGLGRHIAETYQGPTLVRPGFFFLSNARWLSPGRLSSRKDNCILQIHRIKVVATSVVTTMCIQKRTEMDQYTIHWLPPCKSKTATKQTQPNKAHKNNKAKPTSNKEHGRWSADQFAGILEY
jgi:hypothetical protein